MEASDYTGCTQAPSSSSSEFTCDLLLAAGLSAYPPNEEDVSLSGSEELVHEEVQSDDIPCLSITF